ncbi:nucleic acid dioxygenase ALKBH1-like isoform X2 [Xenia sp. Carnegie-2017]|uniref:nucleic acid dioxygenase ALKBH1-like isoform X2 n=1 Tax=Xenia sp. Carnegie-2017 TaxID=2897299 RepID=UPI001F036EF9|nr:nucleic acid dioxygenase ALKBH1-like isoform X2 [Xenia sp. Carnegie-2017]
MSFEDFLHVKSTNMAAEKSREILSSNTLNAVREEYKRYKRRSKAPDFGDVIDFENPSTFSGRAVEVDVSNMPNEPLNCHSFGLVSPTNWKAFEVVSCPGFMFIINPFKKGFQHYMVQRLLKDFPRKPNATNLVVHKDIVLQDDESFWDYCMKSTRPDDINKLRWTHLGYQFDYNKEEYKSDAYFGFPQDLACLVTYIAATLGFHDYQPQSGVVNYYPLGSSMGGHVDRYENDLSQPLISISFGQSAIYLIGGKTCDIRPTVILIILTSPCCYPRRLRKIHC